MRMVSFDADGGTATFTGDERIVRADERLRDFSTAQYTSPEQMHALLREIVNLYRLRGTVAGIKRFVEIYTGIRPEILEGFLERPLESSILGTNGIRLGATTMLAPASATATAEEMLDARNPGPGFYLSGPDKKRTPLTGVAVGANGRLTVRSADGKQAVALGVRVADQYLALRIEQLDGILTAD